MRINLANNFAGIILILSETQKLRLSRDDITISLISNIKGCIESELPEGTLIEVLVHKDCKKEYVETSNVDAFCPKDKVSLGG